MHCAPYALCTRRLVSILSLPIRYSLHILLSLPVRCSQWGCPRMGEVCQVLGLAHDSRAWFCIVAGCAVDVLKCGRPVLRCECAGNCKPACVRRGPAGARPPPCSTAGTAGGTAWSTAGTAGSIAPCTSRAPGGPRGVAGRGCWGGQGIPATAGAAWSTAGAARSGGALVAACSHVVTCSGGTGHLRVTCWSLLPHLWLHFQHSGYVLGHLVAARMQFFC